MQANAHRGANAIDRGRVGAERAASIPFHTDGGALITFSCRTTFAEN
jgi:hypothetical protein